MHLKRNKIGKSWPIPKKGTKYVAMSTHNQTESISLIVVARDILKIVRNKKELKKIINEKQVLINQKQIRDINYPVCLFDILTLLSSNKNYKASLSEIKKISFVEVSEKESQVKIFKVKSKKILSGKKVQLNLMHGKNIISKEKADVGDSVVFNFKENKIEKIIPMQKGKQAFVTKGKHAGVKGTIENIIERGGKNIAKIKISNPNSKESKINVWVKNLIVTG